MIILHEEGLALCCSGHEVCEVLYTHMHYIASGVLGVKSTYLTSILAQVKYNNNQLYSRVVCSINLIPIHKCYVRYIIILLEISDI